MSLGTYLMQAYTLPGSAMTEQEFATLKRGELLEGPAGSFWMIMQTYGTPENKPFYDVICIKSGASWTECGVEIQAYVSKTWRRTQAENPMTEQEFATLRPGDLIRLGKSEDIFVVLDGHYPYKNVVYYTVQCIFSVDNVYHTYARSAGRSTEAHICTAWERYHTASGE